MGKVKKNLGLGYLITAAFFLFNPNIVIIDFLPDFIGYALIMAGLSQLGDINHQMESSIKLFKRMFIVSLSQFLSLFFIFGVLPSRERSSALMLICFAFGTLELILLIPAFKAMYDGFIYLGSRHDTTSIFKRREITSKKNKTIRLGMTATARAMVMTMVFIISKPVLTFAPEILAMYDTRIDPNLPVNFYRFIDTFRLISWVFLLPIGIVWLVTFIKYISSITKDRPFIESLSAKYTDEIAPKTFLFAQRYIKLAFIILSIALAFNIDFYVDYASVLPDFVSPIIFLAMLFVMRKFGKVPAKCYVFSVGYMAVSFVTYILNVTFYSNHTLSMTFLYPDAYNAFITLAASKTLDSIFFVCMVLSVLPILSRIIMENTGFMPISSGNYNMEDKIKYIHDMLKKKLRIIIALTVLAGISSICYVIFLRSFIYIWLIEFVVYIIFVVYFIHTLNSIREEMEYKYMLS